MHIHVRCYMYHENTMHVCVDHYNAGAYVSMYMRRQTSNFELGSKFTGLLSHSLKLQMIIIMHEIYNSHYHYIKQAELLALQASRNCIRP